MHRFLHRNPAQWTSALSAALHSAQMNIRYFSMIPKLLSLSLQLQIQGENLFHESPSIKMMSRLALFLVTLVELEPWNPLKLSRTQQHRRYPQLPQQQLQRHQESPLHLPLANLPFRECRSDNLTVQEDQED
jgi:hypothetical protein